MQPGIVFVVDMGDGASIFLVNVDVRHVVNVVVIGLGGLVIDMGDVAQRLPCRRNG